MNAFTSNALRKQEDQACGFSHDYVRIDGRRIHCITAGQGAPVLLIPGWPQTWYAWRHVMQALAAQGAVVRSGLGGFLYLNILDASFSFVFSARPGTPAANLPDTTPQAEKLARLQELRAALVDGLRRFHEQSPDELGPDRDRLRRYALPELERPGYNWAKGVVHDIAYLGGHSVYYIKLPSGGVLQAFMANAECHVKLPTWEEEVYVYWWDDSGVVLQA